VTDVEPNFKEQGQCGCISSGCPREGVLNKHIYRDGTRHIRGCPCARCRGRKTRRGGNDGQRDTARRVGVTKVGSILASHEELYDGETRIEVKTGAQIRPLINAFDKHMAQSEASRPVGDSRPFVLHVRLVPHGKRQLTTFESSSDDEYKQTLYAMCLQAGVTVP
jgi:hypothetical protein